jgi:leucyl aminopeptidase (aminopeptidase T)
LIEFTQELPNLRVASMPGVMKSMEQTALAADYSEVARKSHILADKLDQAVGAKVEFSTGHQLYLDLRSRKAEADDGQLYADKKGIRFINLPSGEAFIAPYEGELEGQPSRTKGMIPVMYDDELVLFRVEENCIVEVIGDGPQVAQKRDYFAVDQARRNIAELGLGCNDKAVISGSVLEDEKVLGLHWAYGRSDHLGGTVGVADFSDPSHVVHYDIVYPKGGGVEIASLVLEYEDGTSEEIIRDGQYTIF